MKRVALIVALVAFVAAVAVVQYEGYRSLRAMRNEVSALARQVRETSQLAHDEAAVALAARQSASESAARATAAAGARQRAEEQKQQADIAREEAAATAQQATQQAQEAQAEMELMRRERQAELDRMQQALNRVVETRRTPNGMVMVLPDSTFRFKFDSAELSPKNRELLSRIAGILLVSKGYGLSVFGYTDDVGTAEYNQQLSVRRAKAVEDYLVQSGIDSSIINAKGYGKTSPLVRGTSAEARAKNRRVEIALTDTSIRYIGAAPSIPR